MSSILHSIEAEHRRYKALGDAAIAQLNGAELNTPGPSVDSIAVIVWHLSGNLVSMFADLLTADGEKPWRLVVDSHQRKATCALGGCSYGRMMS